MSTYYDLKCLDCDELFCEDIDGFRSSGDYLAYLWEQRNHVIEIFRLQATLIRICNNLQRLDVEVEPIKLQSYTIRNPDFFKIHKDHNVDVIDGYGHLRGLCNKQITCGSCGTYHYCSLSRNHEGSCGRITVS